MISTSIYTYSPSLRLFGRSFFTMEIGFGGEISVFSYVQSARIFPEYNTNELVAVVFSVFSLIGGLVGTWCFFSYYHSLILIEIHARNARSKCTLEYTFEYTLEYHENSDTNARTQVPLRH